MTNSEPPHPNPLPQGERELIGDNYLGHGPRWGDELTVETNSRILSAQ
jgi:hypothetical protein